MSLTHWQPFQEMETLRRQLDRLVDDLAPVNRQAAWAPAIELTNSDTDLVLRAELPGIDAKDLDVQVTREAVAIAGEYRFENKTEGDRVFRSEFRYGHFRRVVPLPVAVQNDQVKADYTNGILTLTLPKMQADSQKVVKVSLTEAAPALAPEATDAPATHEAPATETSDVWTDAQ